MVKCRLKCPNCESDFGQESRLLDHLTDVHGITDHLGLYLRINHSGMHPTCSCSDSCTEVLKWAGWKKGFTSKYVRGHNARVDSCWHDPEKQKQFVEKRLEGYATGRNVAWNSGLTKETSDVVATASKKIAATLNEGYASGKYTSWQSRPGASFDKMSEAKRLTPQEIIKRIENCAPNFVLVSLLSNYVRRQRERLQVKCKVCGEISLKSLEMLETTPKCHNCHPVASYPEVLLLNYVSSIIPNLKVLSGDRSAISPQELDIYVPEKRFAIEFNGLTFHHSGVLPVDYHSNKTKICSEKSINLMHIFSDEWRDKTEIVKSMISNRLGVTPTKIGARECSIKRLSTEQRKQFFDQNHIDGDVRAAISYGLFDKNQVLVAAISYRVFNKLSRGKYTGAIELARFCTLRYHNIPGALSRLIHHSKQWCVSNSYNRVVSYVDRRHGTGNSYRSVGFEQIGETPNRFWWTDNSQRFDRFEYRANKSKGLSEKDVARIAGVNRIYGCPNLVFELRL